MKLQSVLHDNHESSQHSTQMLQNECPVLGVHQAVENTYVLTIQAGAISKLVKAGQFVNIRVEGGTEPLLRRPFSVYRTNGPNIEIIFNVVGKGSTILSHKKAGDTVNIIGPLGVPFTLRSDRYETALLVAGGLGVAPLPITTSALKQAGKTVITFLGTRTAGQLVPNHLENVQVATEDGSKGFHGNVVQLLDAFYEEHAVPRPMVFACGPTKMLHAVANFAIARDIPCEVSMEGPMACGFGICQGCPVELVQGEKKYALMCKDGPTFDVRKIRIPA